LIPKVAPERCHQSQQSIEHCDLFSLRRTPRA
jgi:hypothetical protein